MQECTSVRFSSAGTGPVGAEAAKVTGKVADSGAVRCVHCPFRS